MKILAFVMRTHWMKIVGLIFIARTFGIIYGIYGKCGLICIIPMENYADDGGL